ncbi:MAG: hypothetical protein IPK66_09730 [Rhodospirillales bacterium]|nr:hypothetical protein [Rhodospirillales bacterium]
MAHPLAKVRRFAGEFFSWWVGELKGLMPAWLLRFLLPPIDELILEPMDTRLVVRRRNGTGERELTTLDFAGVAPAETKAALRPIVDSLDLARTSVVVRMSPRLALRKMVDLPAAAEENLRQVMAFEMDRLTPFAADAVYFDVRVADRDAARKRLSAELTVLPRAAVDPAVGRIRDAGLEPEAVVLPPRPAPGLVPGSVPAPARGESSQAVSAPWRVPLANGGSGGLRRIGRLAIGLLVLAAGLFAAGLYSAFSRDAEHLAALDRQVASARSEAEEGRKLEEQIERLSSEGDFIVEKKRARPPVLAVLSELTHALPDDTWLYRLRMTSEEMQTFGYSPNASAIIGHIENTTLFSNAQFRAPLTRDQRLEAEQFHIAFQVGRKDQP